MFYQQFLAINSQNSNQLLRAFYPKRQIPEAALHSTDMLQQHQEDANTNGFFCPFGFCWAFHTQVPSKEMLMCYEPVCS